MVTKNHVNRKIEGENQAFFTDLRNICKPKKINNCYFPQKWKELIGLHDKFIQQILLLSLLVHRFCIQTMDLHVHQTLNIIRFCTVDHTESVAIRLCFPLS